MTPPNSGVIGRRGTWTLFTCIPIEVSNIDTSLTDNSPQQDPSCIVESSQLSYASWRKVRKNINDFQIFVWRGLKIITKHDSDVQLLDIDEFLWVPKLQSRFAVIWNFSSIFYWTFPFPCDIGTSRLIYLYTFHMLSSLYVLFIKTSYYSFNI